MRLIGMSKDSEPGHPNQAQTPGVGARTQGTLCPSGANVIDVTVGAKPSLPAWFKSRLLTS